MPTITTTVTSAAATGVVTTQTTTEATPEPPAPAPTPAAAAAAPAPILKDGHPVNESIFPKCGIPADPEGVTKEWITSVMQSRGIISKSTTVTNTETRQIGEGRGYANYTILVKLTYSRPQHPDVPTAVCVKIANKTFQEMMLATKPPFIWEFMNNFYVCESNFYSDYRPNLSVPCCKYYWSEVEYPEDPTTQFGAYGLMIEYLGDDLKMYDVNKGIPTDDLIDALQTAAKIHATSWNDDYCKDVRSGGTNFYTNDASRMGELMQTFGAPGWDSYCEVVAKDTSPEIAAGMKVAFDLLPKWFNQGVAGNHTLSSMDLRAENLLWKKTGPESYECVAIDHQAWWYAPPTRDVAMLMFTSLQKDRIAPDLQKCCKAYYDALVEAGVTGYSYEMFQKDLAVSAWMPLIFAGAFMETCDAMEVAVKEMDGTEPNYQEAKNMFDNMTQLLEDFKSKALISMDTMGQPVLDALDFIKACK